MSEPFLAEIRIVGFNFAPRGWAFCDGQILPISQNQSLYSLLGTTYGGDGRTSFALPDLRGRSPMHVDGEHPLGQKGGEETHTLSAAEMPDHDHDPPKASSQAANTGDPAGNLLADPPLSVGQIYSQQNATLNAQMASAMVANVGGGQAHENRQPYTAVYFCIALQGLFPSRN